MAQVTKTAFAKQDLLDIFEFVAADDAAQAVKLLRLINENCRLLAAFPAMGRAQPHLFINLRSFPVKNYMIFYHPIENGIDVLRVLHGSRDIDEAFNQMIDDADAVN